MTEQQQERQHQENIQTAKTNKKSLSFEININSVLTTVFGLAIMAVCTGAYSELKSHGESLNTLVTKLPYIEQDVSDLKIEMKTKIGRNEFEQRLGSKNEKN